MKLVDLATAYRRTSLEFPAGDLHADICLDAAALPLVFSEGPLGALLLNDGTTREQVRDGGRVLRELVAEADALLRGEKTT